MKLEQILELKISRENDLILLSMEHIAILRKELKAIEKEQNIARKRKLLRRKADERTKISGN